MRISDWSSDVCSSDLHLPVGVGYRAQGAGGTRPPDRRPAQLPVGRAGGLSGADRLQRDPARRRLRHQRLHQRGDEAGPRDPQDPRRRHDRRDATVVRVPVFYGHSEAVNVETRDKLTAARARELLQAAPGVEVVDEPADGGYPTPVTHTSGNDAVFVGRIREDLSHERGLNLWVVSDNIRKGAALNAVQIAELLAAED